MARQKKESRYYQTCLSIRANKVVQYTKVYRPADATLERMLAEGKIVKKMPDRTGKVLDGSMSYKSVQRLRDAINILVATAVSKKLYVDDMQVWINFKINFVTLTLPSQQVHSDREIHRKIFVKFVERWKRHNSKLLYIYKAEKQDNGNLHYHLTTNSFLHHRRLRKWWNKATEALGYISRASTKDPNSTDVHAVRKVEKLAAYLSSYMCKKDKYKKYIRQLLTGRKKKIVLSTAPLFMFVKKHNSILKEVVRMKAWDCSNALLAKPLSVVFLDHVEAANEIYETADRVCSYDYVTVAYRNIFKLDDKNSIKLEYRNYIAHLVAINAAATHVLN